MESEQIVLYTILNIYNSKGYITFDDILEQCALYELTFIHAEIICNNLMDNGVKIEWHTSKNESEISLSNEQKVKQVSVSTSDEKPEQVIINTLFNKFQNQGYITENDIFELCDEYSLSFVKTDYVSNQLLEKGVLISDEIKTISDSVNNTQKVIYEPSQVNYNDIYEYFLYNYPEMKSVIEFSKSILPIQKGEFKQLITQMKSGNKFARETIINKHIRVALRFTLHYKEKTSIPLCDVFSEAMLGVVKAVDTFDPYVNSHFSSYVSLWIKQHVERYINDFERVIRIPIYQREKVSKAAVIEKQNPGLDDKELIEFIAQELGIDNEEAKIIFTYMRPEELISIEELLNSDIDIFTYDSIYLEESVDEIAMKFLLKENVKLCMETLSDREKKIISLRYGIEDGDCKTLEEIGQMMNVTRERIRQIEVKALKKLRYHSCSKNLKDFISYSYEENETDYDISNKTQDKKSQKSKIENYPECTMYFW